MEQPQQKEPQGDYAHVVVSTNRLIEMLRPIAAVTGDNPYKLEISAEAGLSVKGTDPANVAFIRATYSPGEFVSSEGNCAPGIDFKRILSTLLRLRKASSAAVTEMTISLNETVQNRPDTDALRQDEYYKVKLTCGDFSETLTATLGSRARKTPKMENIPENPISIFMPASRLKKIVGQIEEQQKEKYDGYIKFIAGYDPTPTLKTTSRIIDSWGVDAIESRTDTWNKGVSIDISGAVQQGSTVSSLFDTSHLSDFLKSIPESTPIELTVGQDFPIRIRTEHLTYMQAPRIESE